MELQRKNGRQDYVNQALAQFKHVKPSQFHKGPSRIDPIQYGAKVQYSKPSDTRPISDTDYKFIHQVTGKFLFYARAVDPTMLHALNCIAWGEQPKQIWRQPATSSTMLHVIPIVPSFTERVT